MFPFETYRNPVNPGLLGMIQTTSRLRQHNTGTPNHQESLFESKNVQNRHQISNVHQNVTAEATSSLNCPNWSKGGG